jgi:hypothetical protein
LRIKLTSLVLLVVLGGSAFAGVPMPSGEQMCLMGDSMGDMDCCKAALMKAQTAESASARLCCAVNCSKDGTSPSSSVRVSPQLQLFISQYPPASQATLPSIVTFGRIDRLHGPPTDSHPAYIRHLSLLI